MADDYKKFIFSPDKHWGYLSKNGRQEPIHDRAAINALLAFAGDFKPDVWIEGGDSLDLSGIAHWNKTKPLNIENLDIERDMEEYAAAVLDPIDSIMKGRGQKDWMEGNHEAWLQDVKQDFPSLRSSPSLNIKKALSLPERGWAFHEQGSTINLGKLLFAHGDTISGGEHMAKAGVIQYEANVRFGHHHTHQVYTKHSPVASKFAKTGAAVGCLCHRNPHYNKKKPNKWVTGFNYGYVFKDGTYTDYFPVIIQGKFVANGRVYRG